MKIFFIFFLFLFFAVVIDVIFFFLGKKIAKIRGKISSSNYPVSLENYFLLYFRFIPFLGYFGNTIVGMNAQIKLKRLILKNLLGNIIRGSVITLGVGVVFLFQNFYFYQFLGQIHENYFIFTHFTLHILFYSSFIIIVSIFYAIKYKNLKKQRKYG